MGKTVNLLLSGIVAFGLAVSVVFACLGGPESVSGRGGAGGEPLLEDGGGAEAGALAPSNAAEEAHSPHAAGAPLTQELYDRLELGMPEPDALEQVGTPPSNTSYIHDGATHDGSQGVVIWRKWSNPDHSYIRLIFENGRLTGKDAHGLS